MSEKEAKRWRAKKGEYYYYIDAVNDMRICCTNDTYCRIDNIHFNKGNYFRTKEEGKSSAEEMCKVLLRQAGELHDFTWAVKQIKDEKASVIYRVKET